MLPWLCRLPKTGEGDATSVFFLNLCKSTSARKIEVAREAFREPRFWERRIGFED